MNAADDYAKQIHIGASPERVFDRADDRSRLRRLVGAGSWVGRRGRRAAGHLRRHRGPLVLQVAQARRPSTVTWNIRECSFLTDWVGATAAFTLGASGDRT